MKDRLAVTSMIKNSILFLFVLFVLSSFKTEAQNSIVRQDSLFSHIILINGKSEIEKLNLLPKTSTLENLFLEVSLVNFKQSKNFIQNPVCIELERNINGKTERLEIARFFLPWFDKETDTKALFTFDISAYSSLFQQNTNLYIESNNTKEPIELNLHFKWKLGHASAKINRIINLWRSGIKGFTYIDKNNSINKQIENKTITVSKEIKYALLKIYLSGNDIKNQIPKEIDCSKFYFLNINGKTVATRPVWRDDCSLNALFPQAGTWNYSRANWCPGQTLRVFEHFIPLGADTTLSINLHLQEDVKKTSGIQSYILSANLILFEKAQYRNDAAIVEILAPNKSFNHNRYNPICGSPVIRVKNTGADTLCSVLIEYGLNKNTNNRYRWRGELAFMEEEIVYLPPLNWYFYYQNNKPNEFCVSIEKVNNKTDEYEGNNALTAVFNLAPVYPNKISIHFYSYKAAEDNILELVDDMGIPLFEASDFVSDSTYTFNLNMLPGCYEFIVYDKKGDGLYFPNEKNGSIKLFNTRTKEELKDFEPNFGAEIRQQFMILK